MKVSTVEVPVILGQVCKKVSEMGEFEVYQARVKDGTSVVVYFVRAGEVLHCFSIAMSDKYPALTEGAWYSGDRIPNPFYA